MRLTQGQRLLCEIGSQADLPLRKTCLMKLLFLLGQETSWGQRSMPYEFVPYHFGAFSFLAYRDLSKLQEAGILTSSEEGVTAVGFGGPRLPESALAVAEVLARYGRWTRDDLMAFTYERYPETAVLTKRPDLLQRPVVRPHAPPQIFTVGYGKWTIDGFLSALITQGISGVIDVRNRACSRIYGFAKTRLSDCLERIGLDYTAAPALGIAAERRRGTEGPEKRRALLASYRADLLSKPELGPQVDQVADALADRARALLCVEPEPEMCHRSVLADIVSERTGLLVTHL